MSKLHHTVVSLPCAVYEQRGARLPAASRCTCASVAGVVVVVDDDEPFGADKSPKKVYIPQITYDAIFRVFPTRLVLHDLLCVAHRLYCGSDHARREAERRGLVAVW